jgi:hypothetical protein
MAGRLPGDWASNLAQVFPKNIALPCRCRFKARAPVQAVWTCAAGASADQRRLRAPCWTLAAAALRAVNTPFWGYREGVRGSETVLSEAREQRRDGLQQTHQSLHDLGANLLGVGERRRTHAP